GGGRGSADVATRGACDAPVRAHDVVRPEATGSPEKPKARSAFQEEGWVVGEKQRARRALRSAAAGRHGQPGKLG
ncbi:hypothetical protein BBIA_2533, partial [Bifidobacterium biavatii DSM 23969]